MCSISTKVVVGVDVGGTNTDAVLIAVNEDPPQVLSSTKCATTRDVTSGVQRAIAIAIADAKPTDTQPLDISRVNIGTTHFVNALIQRKHLTKVSVIRLCGPSSRYVPPFSEFEDDLRSHIKGNIFMVDGGYEYDGKVIKEISTDEIDECVSISLKNGINHFAVSGIFSAVRNQQEEETKKIILNVCPTASVTLSSEIGQLGLLERENAAILNECLKPLSKKTLESFEKAINALGLNCPLYLTQNDGTIIDTRKVLNHPISTFASGTTNSMRGAAFLSGVKDAIVIDIGGTTTDVGVLRQGFPREASSEVKIGGIRTNFRMPDVLSIGLGGGSYVSLDPEIQVGPLSAGYNLKNEALVFASEEDKHKKNVRRLTATDIAVAGNLCDIGISKNVKHLKPSLVISKIREMVEEVVDRIKTSNEELPVILVGGGAIILDSTKPFHGASKVIKPFCSDVANAVGAALSQVSGNVDKVYSLMDYFDNEELEHQITELNGNEGFSTLQKESQEANLRKFYFEKARNAVVAHAMEIAVSTAVANGANRKTINFLEKSDTPLSYLPGNATRIQIKAVGNLLSENDVVNTISNFCLPDEKITDEQEFEKDSHSSLTNDNRKNVEFMYDPFINEYGEWILSEFDVECIGTGAGILGCGGGGNPYLGKLMGKMAVRDGKIIRVITPGNLKRVLQSKTANKGKQCMAIPIAMMGAPLIAKEKLVSRETVKAIRCMENLYKNGYCNGQLTPSIDQNISMDAGTKYISHYEKKSKAANMNDNLYMPAIVYFEIGGLNSMEPLLASAELGIPALDADLMGRAFPEMQMTSLFIYGKPAYPAAISDDKGRSDIVLEATNAKGVENYFRNVAIEMGCSAGVAVSSVHIPEDLEKLIPHSLSYAWRLGRAVLKSRLEKTSPIESILEISYGALSMIGKICDVSRETSGGFSRGFVKIDGMDDFSEKRAVIDFQNENLLTRVGSKNEVNDDNLEVVSCVPDLITIVDNDTGEPIPTEDVRYGQRVAVMTLPCHPLLKTPQALKIVGPQAFGYNNVKFEPCRSYSPLPPVAPI